MMLGTYVYDLAVPNPTEPTVRIKLSPEASWWATNLAPIINNESVGKLHIPALSDKTIVCERVQKALILDVLMGVCCVANDSDTTTKRALAVSVSLLALERLFNVISERNDRPEVSKAQLLSIHHWRVAGGNGCSFGVTVSPEARKWLNAMETHSGWEDIRARVARMMCLVLSQFGLDHSPLGCAHRIESRHVCSVVVSSLGRAYLSVGAGQGLFPSEDDNYKGDAYELYASRMSVRHQLALFAGVAMLYGIMREHGA